MNKNVTYLDSVIVAPTSFSSLLILYCYSLLGLLSFSYFVLHIFRTVLFPSGTVKFFLAILVVGQCCLYVCCFIYDIGIDFNSTLPLLISLLTIRDTIQSPSEILVTAFRCRYRYRVLRAG